MKKCGMRASAFAALFFLACCLYGQQNYTLVIGNAAYTAVTSRFFR